MDKIIGITSGILRKIGHVVVISEPANVITNFDDLRVVGSSASATSEGFLK